MKGSVREKSVSVTFELCCVIWYCIVLCCTSLLIQQRCYGDIYIMCGNPIVQRYGHVK